ncbi:MULTISPECIES: 16S rRNA (uracil(1498)-N(3))-methyltransferase [Corynebacterium]|jgi:16S rRNA (uracil1498-N3)-methyltransferase|uniref:16S rRNA (uracil(1498)-N(3))-methyltransferase n=1 Tax=Corynebacterium TaxID=1716 RepID=UPI00082F7907|nr:MULTISPECIES: 16S rRNA (uracil(1498)-N(3))-methyltransferase [Corynebacterium]MCI1257110.1 16S rRNA (uracil(1498)-N(3))-methyltransferase [Corynebacterium provencense]
MTDPVFLVPDLPAQIDRAGVTGLLRLPPAEARHAGVKRIRRGEQIVLTDGAGLGVTATWTGEGDTATGTGVLPRRTPRPRVTVVQALPKAERSELAVDLAVQAGADRIIPWQADRCIAKWDRKAAKARSRWEATAVSAMKQSRRTEGAVVGELLTDIAGLPRALSGRPWREPVETTRILVLHEEAATPLAEIDLDVDEIVLVIGPEGGVSPRELAVVASFDDPGGPVVLGPEVYRSAAAAAVALGAVGVLTDRWAR